MSFQTVIFYFLKTGHGMNNIVKTEIIFQSYVFYHLKLCGMFYINLGVHQCLHWWYAECADCSEGNHHSNAQQFHQKITRSKQQWRARGMLSLSLSQDWTRW